MVMESLCKKTDVDQVGVYEAGLVQDPAIEKRAALDLFIRSLKEGISLETKLLERYVRVMHGSIGLFMSSDYAKLSDKHGWLLQETAK